MKHRVLHTALVAALSVLMIVSGTALAGDKEKRPSASPTPDGGVTTQAFFCSLLGTTVKVNANTVGSQAFEICSGTVTVQQVRAFLELCDVQWLGVCLHWETIRTYASCSKFGPGPLSCPNVNTYNARPGPGKYRTRAEGVVSEPGSQRSATSWGTEVILN